MRLDCLLGLTDPGEPALGNLACLDPQPHPEPAPAVLLGEHRLGRRWRLEDSSATNRPSRLSDAPTANSAGMMVTGWSLLKDGKWSY